MAAPVTCLPTRQLGVVCHTCGKPCDLMEHSFEEGLAPFSREWEEKRLGHPIRNRSWRYTAPLYHLRINGAVIPFCSPACVSSSTPLTRSQLS